MNTGRRDTSSPLTHRSGIGATWIVALIASITLGALVVMATPEAVTDIGAELITSPVLVTFTSSDDEYVATDNDNLGNVVAVWQANGKVYRSRKDGGGSIWTSPVAFAGSTTDSGPDIATDRNGNWVVVYAAHDGSRQRIMVSRSSNNGLNWTAPTVLAEPLWVNYAPSLATDGNGHWVVAFTTDSEGFDLDIMASRSDDNGANWEGPVLIHGYMRTDNYPGYERNDILPDIATDSAGEWMLTWSSDHSDAGAEFCQAPTGDRAIFAARSLTHGEYWSMYRCPHSYGNAGAPSVAAYESGFIVTWDQETRIEGSPGDRDIYVNRYSAGEWLLESIPLNTDYLTDSVSDVWSQVSADLQGNIVAVWQRGETEHDLYVARSTDGGLSWVDQALTPNAASDTADDRLPALAFSPGDYSTWNVYFQSAGRDFAEFTIYHQSVWLQVPVNDNWEDAIAMPESGPTDYGTLEASDNDGSASCGNSASEGEVWYSYSAFVPGTLRAFTCGSNDSWGTDTVVSLHTAPGPGTTANEIACNDDWDGVSPFPDGCPFGLDTSPFRDSVAAAAVSAGDDILVRVSRYPGTPGDIFGLTMRLEPVNNHCGDAMRVRTGASFEWTTAGTGTDGADSCVTNSGADTWYEFTAPTNGTLQVTTCGTHDLLAGIDLGSDTVLSLHQWCSTVDPPAVNDVLCNDSYNTSTIPTACQFQDFGAVGDAALEYSMSRNDEILIRVADANSAPFYHYLLNVSFICEPSPEVCDGLDNDCDGEIDEGLSTDNDGDGHYAHGSCLSPADDCDDNDPDNFPGNHEICDGDDNDCDGLVDEGLSTDDDGDGHYTPGSCSSPADDCDDSSPNVFPGNPEVCDGIDNDCDTVVDEGLSTDNDGDGHYLPGSCLSPADDCNDSNPNVFPGNPEICDGIDNDCDTVVDEGLSTDNDGDGHYAPGSCLSPADDCNDSNPNVFPGNPEICDGIDNDCDTVVDEGLSTDNDGDGHYTTGSCLSPADDCNDSNSNVHPGHPELCDGLDNDCDTAVDEGLSTDSDGDGHYAPGSCFSPADDCDDSDSNNFPGNTEVCDFTDNDCDTVVDEGFDADGDGISVCAGDCDDSDPAIPQCNTFPGSGQSFSDPTGQCTVTFGNTTTPGYTSVEVGPCSSPPSSIVLTTGDGVCISVETTSGFDEAEICVTYDDSNLTIPEEFLRLVDTSVSPPEILPLSPSTDLDNNILCAYATHFSVLALGVPAPGYVPDGRDPAYQPLLIEKVSPTEILLTWDRSCSPEDFDYVVHEGLIGDFTSHVPLDGECSNQGQVSKIVSGIGESRYYLVMSTNGIYGGSLGLQSSGERTPGQLLCFPQVLADVCE